MIQFSNILTRIICQTQKETNKTTLKRVTAGRQRYYILFVFICVSERERECVCVCVCVCVCACVCVYLRTPGYILMQGIVPNQGSSALTFPKKLFFVSQKFFFLFSPDSCDIISIDCVTFWIHLSNQCVSELICAFSLSNFFNLKSIIELGYYPSYHTFKTYVTVTSVANS